MPGTQGPTFLRDARKAKQYARLFDFRKQYKDLAPPGKPGGAGSLTAA
jgi:hypothetical protein